MKHCGLDVTEMQGETESCGVGSWGSCGGSVRTVRTVEIPRGLPLLRNTRWRVMKPTPLRLLWRFQHRQWRSAPPASGRATCDITFILLSHPPNPSHPTLLPNWSLNPQRLCWCAAKLKATKLKGRNKGGRILGPFGWNAVLGCFPIYNSNLVFSLCEIRPLRSCLPAFKQQKHTSVFLDASQYLRQIGCPTNQWLGVSVAETSRKFTTVPLN